MIKAKMNYYLKNCIIIHSSDIKLIVKNFFKRNMWTNKMNFGIIRITNTI